MFPGCFLSLSLDYLSRCKVKLFENLCRQFKIDLRVAEYLVTTAGCENLADFRTLLTKPEEASIKVTSKIVGLAKPMVEESRLIQAWQACQDAAEVAKTRKAQGMDETELDALLDSTELDQFRTRFYRRCKLHFESDSQLGDRLLSRVIREVRKNSLTLFVAFKVITLANQTMSERKRRRIMGPIELIENDPKEVPPAETTEVYLELLEVYLTGLAMAGIEERVSKPPEEEIPGRSTSYVVIPLDILLNYFKRAKLTCMKVPAGHRLTWVRHRDEAERKVWVEKIRMPGNTSTLGEIILRTYEAREQAWIYEGTSAPRPAPADPLTPVKAGRPAPADVQGVAVLGTYAQATKDGKKLCSTWQSGGCIDKGPCSGGNLHACAVVIKTGGRVCGLSNHRGKDCKFKGK